MRRRMAVVLALVVMGLLLYLLAAQPAPVSVAPEAKSDPPPAIAEAGSHELPPVEVGPNHASRPNPQKRHTAQRETESPPDPYWTGEAVTGWKRCEQFSAKVKPEAGFDLFPPFEVTSDEVAALVAANPDARIQVHVTEMSGNNEPIGDGGESEYNVRDLLDQNAMRTDLLDPFLRDCVNALVKNEMIESFLTQHDLAPPSASIEIEVVRTEQGTELVFRSDDAILSRTSFTEEPAWLGDELDPRAVEEREWQFQALRRSTVEEIGLRSFGQNVSLYVTGEEMSRYFPSSTIQRNQLYDFLRTHASVEVTIPEELREAERRTLPGDSP